MIEPSVIFWAVVVMVVFVVGAAGIVYGAKQRRGDWAGVGVVLLAVWGMAIFVRPWLHF